MGVSFPIGVKCVAEVVRCSLFALRHCSTSNNAIQTSADSLQNGINFGVTFYGLYIVEHYGRRKSLIAGSCWMFICFLIFASVGHFALDRENPENTESAATAMICFACFFIFGFATTWGPMM